MTVLPSSTGLPRPARGITPDVFYTEYMPQLWLALVGSRSYPWPAAPLQVGVELVGGSSHQSFCLEFGGPTVRATAEKAARPHLQVSMSVDGWRAGVRDVLPEVLRRTSRDLDRVQSGLLRALQAHGSRLTPDLLLSNSGVITIVYTDDAGDRIDLVITIGTSGGPRVTITMGDADLWALLQPNGSLVRLLTSKLRVDGESGYVLRLLALLGLDS